MNHPTTTIEYLDIDDRNSTCGMVQHGNPVSHAFLLEKIETYELITNSLSGILLNIYICIYIYIYTPNSVYSNSIFISWQHMTT